MFTANHVATVIAAAHPAPAQVATGIRDMWVPIVGLVLILAGILLPKREKQ